MQIIEGMYNMAKVYTDHIEETAKGQIKLLCDQEYVKDAPA